MSRTIPHRELRNNSSAILREVANGDTVEITNHGTVVAILVPPRTAPVDSVRVKPASVRGGFRSMQRVRSEQTTSALLDELRGEP